MPANDALRIRLRLGQAEAISALGDRPRARALMETLRADAVRLRGEDEQSMLAAADASARADIDALRQVLAQASATHERDLLLGLVAGQTQLLRSALQLERLRIESG